MPPDAERHAIEAVRSAAVELYEALVKESCPAVPGVSALLGEIDAAIEGRIPAHEALRNARSLFQTMMGRGPLGDFVAGRDDARDRTAVNERIDALVRRVAGQLA